MALTEGEQHKLDSWWRAVGHSDLENEPKGRVSAAGAIERQVHLQALLETTTVGAVSGTTLYALAGGS